MRLFRSGMTGRRLAGWMTAFALCLAPAVVRGEVPASMRALIDSNKARVAYAALDLRDGRVLGLYDSTRPMIPASVQKLCTAAVALEVLGADFLFTTRLAEFEGNLFVIGDGDPTLGDPELAAATGLGIYDVLDAWAAGLAASGAVEVAGDLVLDDDIFRARRHPAWPEDQNRRWYCAPVSGLSYHNNCLDIRLAVTEQGVVAEVEPQSSLMVVRSSIQTGRRNTWSVVLEEDDAIVSLRGEAARTMIDPLSVAVDHPSLLLGRVFADRLQRSGVTLQGEVVRAIVAGEDRSLPAGVRELARHETPISVAVHRALKDSLNLAAECLLLRATAKAEGRGDYALAPRLAERILTERFGMPAGQFVVSDGSGMSRVNRVSPSAMVSLLQKLADGPHRELTLRSLAHAGVDGTLERRLRPLAGRLVAKTGSLDGVTALAGYILDDSGRPVVALAVFVNDIRCPKWKAKQAVDDLVRQWAEVAQ